MTGLYIELRTWNQVNYDPSQLWTQFKQLRMKKPEKFRTSTRFEPVTSRYRCDALTNWAMKPLTLRAGHLWVLIKENPHNCDDHSSLDFTSAVPYTKHAIYLFSFIPHGFIRTHKWAGHNMSGFIAQLVRASHRYREVTPLKSWLFQASVRNCLDCVQNCHDHGLLNTFHV